MPLPAPDVHSLIPSHPEELNVGRKIPDQRPPERLVFCVENHTAQLCLPPRRHAIRTGHFDGRRQRLITLLLARFPTPYSTFGAVDRGLLKPTTRLIRHLRCHAARVPSPEHLARASPLHPRVQNLRDERQP